MLSIRLFTKVITSNSFTIQICHLKLTCSGLLTGSLPVDILSTGLMTLEPEDEVEGETVVGIICSDEPWMF